MSPDVVDEEDQSDRDIKFGQIVRQQWDGCVIIWDLVGQAGYFYDSSKVSIVLELGALVKFAIDSVTGHASVCFLINPRNLPTDVKPFLPIVQHDPPDPAGDDLSLSEKIFHKKRARG